MLIAIKNLFWEFVLTMLIFVAFAYCNVASAATLYDRVVFSPEGVPAQIPMSGIEVKERK